MRYAFFLIITLATLLACESDFTSDKANATTAPVAIRWAHLDNMQDGEQKFRTHWTLLNHSADTLPATGWITSSVAGITAFRCQGRSSKMVCEQM